MNPRVKAIMDQVEQLSEEERLELEHGILVAEDQSIENAWVDECARRLAEVREGKVQTLSIEEVMDRLRATE